MVDGLNYFVFPSSFLTFCNSYAFVLWLENLALAPSGDLRCSYWTAGQCMAVQTTFAGVPCVPRIHRSAHHHSDPSRQEHGSCTLTPEAGRWYQLSPHGGCFLQGYLCLQPGVISASAALGSGDFPLVSLLVAPFSPRVLSPRWETSAESASSLLVLAQVPGKAVIGRDCITYSA